MPDKTSTRREFLKAAGLSTFGLALSDVTSADLPPARRLQELLLYVGTYTTAKSEGIYLYRLNLASGELKHAQTVKGVVNPSFLTLDSRRRYLYAVNEVEEFGGQKSGAVSAFSIDRRTGGLRLLNQQPSRGGAPCYVTVDATDKFVLVANYLGGNVSVLPVRRDGSLGEATDVQQFTGSSVNRERQEAPHAHCILLDKMNRHAYACDLGTDRIMLYRFDAKGGKLIPNETPFASVKAGAGPRHLTFHPSNTYAYVANELDLTVTAFEHNQAKGTLKEVQTVSTLPDGLTGPSTSADIHTSPDGRFLYVSNRGHDRLAAFKIDARTGRLRLIAHTPTQGKTPRNFAIDPTGAYLLVANQNSDSIVTFRIDKQTGKLRPTGHVAE
ncbi:MAG TPA: lactonase family protein, partial [Pyrinomonadaceae bacterium]|nr:lactonase family protein [Pyrinomonadaceae bacterium]